jgi:hypothetical protein
MQTTVLPLLRRHHFLLSRRPHQYLCQAHSAPLGVLGQVLGVSLVHRRLQVQFPVLAMVRVVVLDILPFS